jgi:gliding motility-associated peptidyl-prolyl isomerase
MIRFLILCCCLILCFWSCQSPEARKPEKSTSGSFIEASVARNKRIYEEEKALIQEVINKDSAYTYISSESGFWYAFTKKDTISNAKKPSYGDLVTFTYNVKDLEGNMILSKEENGIQTYKVDQSNQELTSGIRDAIKLLALGESATFIFPSYKAYGYYGIQEKLGTNVPVSSNITLLSIN